MSALTLSSLPVAPSKPQHLRAFALGPQLHQWSEAFQPELLGTADLALANVQRLMESVSQQRQALSDRRGCCLFTTDEDAAEEVRLTQQLERAVTMLDRLGAFHARTTSVSAAALLHAMTRGRLASDSAVHERSVTPRRTLGSASDLVVHEG